MNMVTNFLIPQKEVPNHHQVSEILFELSRCALTHLHNMQPGMSAIWDRNVIMSESREYCILYILI